MEPPGSALCGRRLPQSGPKGVDLEIRRGLTLGGGEGHTHGARGPLSCEPNGPCTSNFPTDDANYRVAVFEPSPLQ